MKKRYLLLLAVAGLVAFGAGCNSTNTNSDDSENTNQEVDLNESLDLNVDVNDDLNVNDDSSDDVNGSVNDDSNTNEDANEDTEEDDSNVNSEATGAGKIKITGPESNEEIESTFYVEGTAAAGSQVYVRMKASGVTIFTEPVSVRNGEFKGKFLIDFSRTTSATIEVFQKDGDVETGLTSIPVRVKIEEKSDENSNVADDDNTNSENENENTNSDESESDY